MKIFPFYLHCGYPLVICYVAIEAMAIEIVDFPSYKMVDLSIAFL